jgi:predicted TIM-barrel fold metal-dependent hydrolase
MVMRSGADPILADSDKRLESLEAQGIVAEVIFTNVFGLPAFFEPTADPEMGWAGIRAYNRWLADFCASVPNRRAGVAMIDLRDIDAAVKEIKWISQAGLRGGIELHGIAPESGLPSYVAPYYEPLWTACEEAGIPVNHHSDGAGTLREPYPSVPLLIALEAPWFAHRALWQLIFGGVLERHPGLRFVLTEQGTGWIPDVLEMLDYRYESARSGRSARLDFASDVGNLSLSPSEYWARQCFVGASFLNPAECELRHKIGVDKIMWGADYDHPEGTTPFTREALRHTFAGVDAGEVQAMVGDNAARVYGFDLDQLRTVADRVGPTKAEIAKPLEEVPAGALSPAFERVREPW